MVRRRVEKNRPRLPEPESLRDQSIQLIHYLVNLIKTLRIRFEAVEDQIEEQDNKMRVRYIDDKVSIELNFDDFIYLVDATGGGVFIDLPDALDAFNARVTYKIRETSGLNPIDIMPKTGQLIEGSPVFVIDGVTIKGVEVASNGKNWFVLNTYT